MKLDLTATDVKLIFDALQRAANSIEDIDSPTHYTRADLKRIERTAVQYRALAEKISEKAWPEDHNLPTGVNICPDGPRRRER